MSTIAKEYEKALELAIRVAYNQGRFDEKRGEYCNLDKYIAVHIAEIEKLLDKDTIFYESRGQG